VADDGTLKRRKGNSEEFMLFSRFTHDIGGQVGPYERPKLAAVAVAQQAPPQTERTKIKVTIFNERGQKLQQIEDGEVIEGEVLEADNGSASLALQSVPRSAAALSPHH
jgi:hypothetical protein